MSSSRRREDNAPSEHNASLWKSEGSLDYQPATTHTASPMCPPPPILAPSTHTHPSPSIADRAILPPPGLRRYFLILLLLPWLPLLRENPVSSQLPRPFVASDDRQVHVRKSTNLAGGGRARVFETQSSKDGRNIAETSLLKITRHFCFPITGILSKHFYSM